MNFFDVIVILSLILSAFSGWRKGFIWQLVQFVVFMVAFYVTTFMSEAVGTMFGVESDLAGVMGFIIIFILAMIAAYVIGHLLRSMFRKLTSESLDATLGVVISCFTSMFFLGVLFSWFEAFNIFMQWVPEESFENSIFCKPLIAMVEFINPFFDQLLP